MFSRSAPNPLCTVCGWKSAHVRLPCLFLRAMLFGSRKLLRKEDHAMQYYFRFNRQRGPVNALQMRLQG
ncbi:hypothetical protein CUJ84_Chr001007 [Rhizobium leguminosarum]|uniref:Uncharacterized protein n=1 Tax=Rhizobium leguminosarum TaxID=384 RepID=A0A2K9YZM2_RHILE|nr:hypothetical protein CUJ84_Chr001007 [Rhizobium leguminosarum]